MFSSSFPSLHHHKKHHCQCHRHHSHDPKISSLLKLISDQVTENHKSMQHKIQKIVERVTVIEHQNTPSVDTAQSTEKSVQSPEKETLNAESINSRSEQIPSNPDCATTSKATQLLEQNSRTSTMAHPSGPIEM